MFTLYATQLFYTNVLWEIWLDHDLTLLYTKEIGIAFSKNLATWLTQICERQKVVVPKATTNDTSKERSLHYHSPGRVSENRNLKILWLMVRIYKYPQLDIDWSWTQNVFKQCSTVLLNNYMSTTLHSSVKEMLLVPDAESLISHSSCPLLGSIYLEEACKSTMLLKTCIILKTWHAQLSLHDPNPKMPRTKTRSATEEQVQAPFESGPWAFLTSNSSYCNHLFPAQSVISSSILAECGLGLQDEGSE